MDLVQKLESRLRKAMEDLEKLSGKHLLGKSTPSPSPPPDAPPPWCSRIFTYIKLDSSLKKKKKVVTCGHLLHLLLLPLVH